MNPLTLHAQQTRKMRTQSGFIAALDQSGGSTPKALAAYGVASSAWKSEEEMFALVHQMRTRLMTRPALQRRPHPGGDPVRRRRWTARSRAGPPPTTCGTPSASFRS